MKKKYLQLCDYIAKACAEKVPGGDKLMEMALAVD